jgi:hypothetical protein
MLWQALGLPEVHTNGREIVVLVCDSCKRVQTHDFVKKNPSKPLGPLENGYGFEAWVYQRPLPCEEKTCKFRLPLFSKESSTMSSAEYAEYADSWNWNGLTCPDGHPVPKPEPEPEPEGE